MAGPVGLLIPSLSFCSKLRRYETAAAAKAALLEFKMRQKRMILGLPFLLVDLVMPQLVVWVVTNELMEMELEQLHLIKTNSLMTMEFLKSSTMVDLVLVAQLM